MEADGDTGRAAEVAGAGTKATRLDAMETICGVAVVVVLSPTVRRGIGGIVQRGRSVGRRCRPSKMVGKVICSAQREAGWRRANVHSCMILARRVQYRRAVDGTQSHVEKCMSLVG